MKHWQTSEDVFYQFDNETINEKYVLVNEQLRKLNNFNAQNFFSEGVGENLHSELLPHLRHGEDADTKLWDEKLAELRALTTEVDNAYIDFLKTANYVEESVQDLGYRSVFKKALGLK